MSFGIRDDQITTEMPRHDPSVTFGSPKLRRDQIRVVVRLMDGAQVEGFIHVPPFSRPLDLLNQREERFIAVTEATLTEPGTESQGMPFLAVNKSQIARMYETDQS